MLYLLLSTSWKCSAGRFPRDPIVVFSTASPIGSSRSPQKPENSGKSREVGRDWPVNGKQRPLKEAAFPEHNLNDRPTGQNLANPEAIVRLDQLRGLIWSILPDNRNPKIVNPWYAFWCLGTI
jgi:hypothetical protein